MANLTLTLPDSITICDGKQITFKTPCNCEDVTNIIIRDKTYQVRDYTNSIPIGAWVEGVLVTIVLDDTNGYAYVSAGSNGTSALHAFHHASDGMDPITPDMIGAVPDTGGIMTGNLSIDKVYPTIELNDSEKGAQTFFQNANHLTWIESRNIIDDVNNYRALIVGDSDGYADLKNAAKVAEKINGTLKYYNLYGEHNKPTPADIGAATGQYISGRGAAIGWQRIAELTDSFGTGIFTMRVTGASAYTSAVFSVARAAANTNSIPHIEVLNCAHLNGATTGGGATKIRVVYSPTYGTQAAWIEIYNSKVANSYITIHSVGNLRTNLLDPSTIGEIPDGYNSVEVDLTSNMLTTNGGITAAGTVTISKPQDLSGTANNSPALIVGGTATTAHMEIDSNEIQAKSDGTTPVALVLNPDGGQVFLGKDNVYSQGNLVMNTGKHLYGKFYTSDTATTLSEVAVVQTAAGTSGSARGTVYLGHNNIKTAIRGSSITTGVLTPTNPAVGTSAARQIKAGTTALTAGTSTLATGAIYLQYE